MGDGTAPLPGSPGWRSLDARQRGVLSSTLAANALLFYDQTAVTVALPVIQREFDSTATQLQWVVTSYLLALAAFMAVAGRLADQYGRRRLFLGGIALFGIASAACALAPTMELLVATRFVQGIGGALMQPLALGTTTRAVDERERGWAVGVLSTGGTTFLVLGPLLGGLVLDLANWRWVFLVTLPVTVFALVQGARWILPSRAPDTRGVDPWAVVLLLLGLGAVVLGITQLIDWGLPAGVLCTAGLLLLAVFVVRELSSPRPLVSLHHLRNRLLGGSLLALFTIQFAVLGFAVYLVLFLQHDLGETAVTAGLVLALAGFGTPLLSPTTGRMTDRHGPRVPVTSGLLLAALGLALVGLAAPERGVAWLVPGLLLFSLSRPAVFTPASVGPLWALPPTERGVASSLVTEARQIGAVLGVAVLGVFVVSTHPGLADNTAELADGFRTAMLVAAGLAAVTALVTWRLIPPSTH